MKTCSIEHQAWHYSTIVGVSNPDERLQDKTVHHSIATAKAPQFSSVHWIIVDWIDLYQVILSSVSSFPACSVYQWKSESGSTGRLKWLLKKSRWLRRCEDAYDRPLHHAWNYPKMQGSMFIYFHSTFWITHLFTDYGPYALSNSACHPRSCVPCQEWRCALETRWTLDRQWLIRGKHRQHGQLWNSSSSEATSHFFRAMIFFGVSFIVSLAPFLARIPLKWFKELMKLQLDR